MNPEPESEEPIELAALSRSELIDLIQQQGEGPIRIQFVGKSTARRIARRVRPRVLEPIKKYGVGTPEEQSVNVLIEGDNLQAMSTLYKIRGHVDLILTDPPYNTGNDFRYNDKWDEDPNDPGIGELVAETDGARHTKWMKFMWPRLQIMRAMLKDSGVLAICIDHRELFRLGQMLDELFGEQNRLAILNWQKSYSPRGDRRHVSTATEYVLVYAKDEKLARTDLLPRTEAMNRRYGSPDGDVRLWKGGDLSGPDAKGHMRMVYGVQSPFTGEIHYPPPGACWRPGKTELKRYLEAWGVEYKEVDLNDHALRAQLIGLPESDVPRVKALMVKGTFGKAKAAARKAMAEPWPRVFFGLDGQGRPQLKYYLEDVKQGKVPTTFWAEESYDFPEEFGAVSWPHAESGHSQTGINELDAILGKGHGFETVKPLKLFSKIISLWCPPSGLVLDPFGGSGTSGHAVWSLNAEAGTNRRFVMIEQGRPERGDSFARTLAAERLKRVTTGDWANGEHDPLPYGFTFMELKKRVDADALLRMERDEMTDTVIFSYFDVVRRSRPSLARVDGERRYLVARNDADEGFFLVWDGPDKNTSLTREVYADIAAEAKEVGLKRVYHIYARQQLYVTTNVRFYQIPDRILADFGLNPMSEPFTEVDD